MLKRATTILAVLVAGALAGCSTTPVTGLLPDLNPPQKALLTPDQQQQAIKELEARKAAQEQMVAIETGAIKH